MMLDYTNFQAVFPPGTQLPYDRHRQQEIDASRKSLDGMLFIDRVLKALGVPKGTPCSVGLKASYSPKCI